MYFSAIDLYEYLRVACFSLSCREFRVSQNRSINCLLFYFINKICDNICTTYKQPNGNRFCLGPVPGTNYECNK